jgi:hypothetical protein
MASVYSLLRRTVAIGEMITEGRDLGPHGNVVFAQSATLITNNCGDTACLSPLSIFLLSPSKDAACLLHSVGPLLDSLYMHVDGSIQHVFPDEWSGLSIDNIKGTVSRDFFLQLFS